MRISVEETGIPIVPCFIFPFITLNDATGEVSVIPQPSATSMPVTSFHLSATARCNAIPPAEVPLSCEWSKFLKSGLFKIPLSKVFMPGKIVGRYFL